MNSSTSFLPGTPGTLGMRDMAPAHQSADLEAIPPLQTRKVDYSLWPIQLGRPTTEQILAVSAHLLGRDPVEITNTRTRHLADVQARHLAALLMRQTCNMSGPEIARAFGVKSHSTFNPSATWPGQLLKTRAGMAIYDAALRLLIGLKKDETLKDAKGTP